MIGYEVDGRGRLVVAYDGGLVEDDSFLVDVIISLFTDARAPDYVDLANEDRRGWWGDSEWGSRIWLLMRRPLTQELLTQLRKAVELCLAWMVKERILASVAVAVTRESRDAVRLAIELVRGDGEKWAVTWTATAERLTSFAVSGPIA